MAAILRALARPGPVAALLVALILLLSTVGVVGAQTDTGGDTRLPPDAIEPLAWPRSTTLFDTPDPFTVNGYDAIQAMAMIRSAGLLIRPVGTEREIVPVETLSAERAGVISTNPAPHRERWQLILNGEPLAWDELYVEYGGRLTNLQLLFTYRNQRPVPNVPFILE